jgi:hypothetical protein
MIRPLTIATLLMACSSGLYLYQSKHEVQLLDRTIERTVHETGALREQSRLLAAEWTMLNDPERLRRFSDTYLGLKTITPSQFTSLADLDNRLPVTQAEIPAGGADEPEPVTAAVENAAPIVDDSASAAVADEVLPVPPIPALPPLPIVASVVRPAEPGVTDRAPVSHPAVADSQPHSVADGRPSDQHPSEQRRADQHPSEQRSADQRPSDQRNAVRVADARTDSRAAVAPPPRPIVVAAPRPLPANPPANPPANQRTYASSSPAPAVSAPAPSATPGQYAPGQYTGSLLGMARGGMPPVPRPTPVVASYNAN